MSYEVDPKTLLFTNKLEWPEAHALMTLCQRIVLDGHIDGEHPAYKAWLAAWMQTPGADESRQQLLTYSVVFPQRALLSLATLFLPNLPGVSRTA